MPEREQHQPTEEEMSRMLAERGFAEKDITDKKGVRGTEQRDAEGRLVLSDEHYENGDHQIIQIEHGEPRGAGEAMKTPSKELGKLVKKTKEGEPTEVMLVREHPRTSHQFSVKGVTPDGQRVNAFGEFVLENLGSTAGEKREPWSHFILEGEAAAKAFKRIKVKPGEKSLKLKGNFGSLETTLGERRINFKTFDQISLDVDDEGKVTKATIHCRDWEEEV